MTTHTDGRPTFDDEIDRRLYAAGTRLRTDVRSSVDVDLRLNEIVSRRSPRRGWLAAGLVAGTALAVLAGVVIATSSAPVVIDPRPDMAGPPPADAPGDDPPGDGAPGDDPSAETPVEDPAPTRPPPDDTDPGEPDCPAVGIDVGGMSTAALPDPVASTRDELVRAAQGCDLDGLADLAGDDLSFSFGDGTDPAAYWQEQQDAGDAPMAVLVQLLALPPGETQTPPADDQGTATGGEQQAIWSWPRAYTDPSMPEHRAELDEMFAPDIVEPWFTPDGEYYGPRVGIREDGTWLFYIAGD